MRKIILEDDQKQKILEKYKEGKGYRKIAKEIGVTETPVLNYLQEQGLHRDFSNKGVHKFQLQENI